MAGNPNEDRGPPEDPPSGGRDSGDRGPPAGEPVRGPLADRGDGRPPSRHQRIQTFDHQVGDISDALTDSARDALETLPNVVGVGVGRKRVDGKPASTPAIRVLVDHKRSLAELAAEDIVPSTVELGIGAVATDVAEAGGGFTPDSGSWSGTPAPNRDARIRPMPGGVEVGVGGAPASSTALVRYDGEAAIVMSRHAVADRRLDPTGNDIYSPAVATDETHIGEVIAVAPWFEGTRRAEADAAVVSVDIADGDPVVSREYLPPVRPREIAHDPALDRRCVQIAAPTGIAGGAILETDVTATVTYSWGSIRYEGLIATTNPGEAGSSGAAVVQMDTRTGRLSIIGMHMGSSPERALVIPWSNLESAFDGDLSL